jgi:hypothetical protein
LRCQKCKQCFTNRPVIRFVQTAPTTARFLTNGDVDAALEAGWHKTPPAAIEAASKPVEEKPKRGRKRSRTDEGQFQADDPATPDINEAFEE